MHVAPKSLQSCPTLCDPIDGSPPGSPVPGILQARTLEWVAISFSNARKWKVKMKSLSRVRLLATPWTAAHQAPPSMGFSRQECWSGVPLPILLTILANSQVHLHHGSPGSSIIGNEIEQPTLLITFNDLPRDPTFKLVYRHWLLNVNYNYICMYIYSINNSVITKTNKRIKTSSTLL